MVDIIRTRFGIIVEPDDFANDENEIINIEHAVGFEVFAARFESLIEAISPDASEIVALVVEEHRIDHLLGIFLGRQIARTKPLVHFFVAFALCPRRVFGERFFDIANFTGIGFRKEFAERRVIPTAKCLEERRYGHLSLAVYFCRDHPVEIGFEFKPCTAIWNDFRPEKLLSLLVIHRKERARRTNKLTHHYALDTIDNKCPPVGHDWEFTQINFLVFHFAGFLEGECRLGAEWRFIRNILRLRGHLVILRLIKVVFAKPKLKIFIRKIANRIHLFEELFETLVPKPRVRTRQNIDKVGKRHHNAPLEELPRRERRTGTKRVSNLQHLLLFSDRFFFGHRKTLTRPRLPREQKSLPQDGSG